MNAGNGEDLGDEDRFFHYRKACAVWQLHLDAQDDDPGKAQLGRFIVYLLSGTKTMATVELEDVKAMTEWMRWYIHLRLLLQVFEAEMGVA